MIRFRFTRARSRRAFAKVTRRERAANRELRESLAEILEGIFTEEHELFAQEIVREGQVLERIQAGASVGGVEDAAGLFTLESRMGIAFDEAYLDAIAEGAQLGLRFAGVEGLSTDPEMITLEARRWIESEGAERIRGINETTRRGVRRTISSILAGNESPEIGAQKIGARVGLSERDADALARFEADLIARRIPTPEADTMAVRETIAREVEARRRKLIRNRGRNIAQTEMQAAIQVGERAFWVAATNDVDQPVDRERLTKTWFTVRDDRVCPICEPLHNTTIGFDEEFTSTAGSDDGTVRFVGLAPPAHPSCRCYLEYDAEGLT